MKDRANQKVHRLVKTALILVMTVGLLRAQNLKSIVYDFDGFDLGATTLPEGDYQYGDLSYQVAADPVSVSDQINDRCLRLNISWVNGYAAFGRGISRYIEFDATQDFFNFYIYNPVSNNQAAQFDISIADDDNQNNTYESASDDNWKKTVTVPGAAGWQLLSIPLTGFTDGNTGGNGVFDIAFTQNKGMLLLVEFRFNKPSGATNNPTFYLDMISFSEGAFLTGSTILDLPPKAPADFCRLGAFQPEANGNNHLIPVHVEGLFPVMPGRKLKYVNTYLQWSYNSTTTANAFPGQSIQTLMNNGYLPIITWEPMFLSLAPLDPAQPDLQDIVGGKFDAYIDSFANHMKTYSDTVIIRFMHEFDGDWYPWCVSQNGQNPALFVSAFQYVVNRFKAKGASKVKWMWCPNSDYAPYQAYNWIVSAYPGNNFVDYVATDIYNGHYPVSLPWWRSFRWQATESCYYLTKYFPTKPLIICELGCRERISGDDPNSQSKADWFAHMDKELQSNFRKVRGLIFFNSNTGTAQNWTMNSSAAALLSLRDNLWYDDYYFGPSTVTADLMQVGPDNHFKVFPNPSNGQIYLQSGSDQATELTVRIYGLDGKCLKKVVTRKNEGGNYVIETSGLPEGFYVLEGEHTNTPENSRIVLRKKIQVTAL